MNLRVSEEDLLPAVTQYFFKKGCLIHREIKIGFCRADLLIFTPEHLVIAVELKLSDWKKALIQAQNYLLGSDYVYIAFPDTKKDLLLKKAATQLKNKGIGLLLIHLQTGQVQEYIKPTRSTRTLGTITLQELHRLTQKKRTMPFHL